jgi:heme/copper-type cytochrome/quinol oxidase subunit 4
MKRNKGVLIFLLSIVLTTLGSVVKVMKVEVLPDILLALGIVAFIVALVMILKGLFRRQSS